MSKTSTVANEMIKLVLIISVTIAMALVLVAMVELSEASSYAYSEAKSMMDDSPELNAMVCAALENEYLSCREYRHICNQEDVEKRLVKLERFIDYHRGGYDSPESLLLAVAAMDKGVVSKRELDRIRRINKKYRDAESKNASIKFITSNCQVGEE
jgi:hypothetical protein